MKKAIFLILTLVLLLSVMPMVYAAGDVIASGKCGDNLTWKLASSGTLTISGSGSMWRIEDHAPWYEYRLDIKSIDIKNGVTGIGSNAFRDCSNLTQAYLPDSIGGIGSCAFMGCSSLKNISIPNGVEAISPNAFYGCSSLRSIEIPASVTWISYFVFANCSNLEGIWVDTANKMYCNDENGVLFNKEMDTLLQAPGGLKGKYAIPDGVSTIAHGAFDGCQNITLIEIPESVTAIWINALDGCSSLEGFRVSIANEQFCNDEFGVLYNKEMSQLIQAPSRLIGDYIIPETVTSMHVGEGVSGAFVGCSLLTSVVIPDGVTYVSPSIFVGCDSLTDIYYGGANLQWQDNNDGLVAPYIHCSCTDYKNHWESVVVASCETDGIVYEACSCGYKRNEKAIPATGHNYVDGVCTVCQEIELLASGACGNNLSWKLDVNETLTIYGTGSMSSYYYSSAPWYKHRNSIQSVVIEDGVTSISSRAFKDCIVLESITIPDSVTSIDSYAFENCHSLTSITIPKGVSEIEVFTFENCTSLESITIPISVTTIHYTAFTNCTALTDVYFGGKSGHWATLGSPPEAAYIHYSCTTPEGHWKSEEVAASCETDGVAYDTCSCGYKRNEETIPATGHNYDADVTSPTCTEQGYTTYTCKCGDSYVDDYVDATGHVYENGICTGCGEKEITYAPGDFDKDGDVDVDDVLTLLWHVLFPEDYPLG